MHYQPSRARFIVASGCCSTKPLSHLVSIIFSKIFHQVQSFHEKSTFYANYNRFWVIQNSIPLISKLKQINSKKQAREISTYDFSTLYTKLTHDDLIRVLGEMVDFVFNGGKGKKDGNRTYLTVCGKSCFFTKKKHGKNSFTKQQIKSFTKHLITQTYFTIGNLLFRQCIGIPMGIDPAPFWANLYLYYYEAKYVTSLISTDKRKALKYKNATRFIDDECNLNDSGEFGHSYHLIYPSELQLKCEHSGLHATFLELDISVIDGIFVYKLFDKRDDFPFSIVRMPDLTGNIPAHMFFGSIMSEFLRIARATLRYNDFLPKAASLYRRMINQGGSEHQILKQVSKAITRHHSAFENYKFTSGQILHQIKTSNQ